MSEPAPAHDADTSPDVTRLLETYLARVHGAMLLSAASESDDVVSELRGHLLEALAATDGSPASLARILEEFGPPEALAEEYGEAGRHLEPISDRGADARSGDESPTPLAGRVLGIPYDLRMPTAQRIADRWWNPLDQRVFVPRVFGAGWDINFAALAIRSGLVRPDDEDEPFASVPDGAVLAAFAVPLLECAVLLVLAALYQSGLPAQVPSSWTFTGQPGRYWDKGLELAFVLAMSVVPVAAAGALFLRRTPAFARVAGTACATLLVTVALAMYWQAIATAGGASGALALAIGLPAVFVLPFLMFVVLSRIGRAAEQRRDLAGPVKKERS
jgi:hypothetical protein